MKVRKGFVSNSSSSSFVCDSCGEEECGWGGLADVEMVELTCGHVLCERHLPDFDNGDDRYNFQTDDCPCCNLEIVEDAVVMKYLFNLTHTDRAFIETEIRAKFKNLREFWEAMEK